MERLNTDCGACFVCGGTTKEYLEFKSKDKHTRVDLCTDHYQGLWKAMWEYLSNGRNNAKGVPERTDHEGRPLPASLPGKPDASETDASGVRSIQPDT